MAPGVSTVINSKVGRFGAFLVTVGVSAALVGLAAHATGAYFSDSKAGTITGTLGSIKVTGSGGNGTNNLDFQFTNLLPGVAQTASGGFQNTGRNPEDVYIVFNNVDALHALNNLGRYGEVHVGANGAEIFASQNLNDNTTSCPPGSTAGGNPACAALPVQLKLASDVAPGNGGTFSFSFDYSTIHAGGLGNTSNIDGATGPAWNSYPLGVNTSAGLPYQIVATQVGVTPGS
jgi:hypothetical protein